MKRQLIWFCLFCILLSGCGSSGGKEVKLMELSDREKDIAAMMGAEVVSAYEIRPESHSFKMIRFQIEKYEHGKLVDHVDKRFDDTSAAEAKKLDFLMLSKLNPSTNKVDYYVSLQHNGTNHVTASIAEPVDNGSSSQIGLDREDFDIQLDKPLVIKVTVENKESGISPFIQEVFEDEQKLEEVIQGNESVTVYKLGFDSQING